MHYRFSFQYIFQKNLATATDLHPLQANCQPSAPSQHNRPSNFQSLQWLLVIFLKLKAFCWAAWRSQSQHPAFHDTAYFIHYRPNKDNWLLFPHNCYQKSKAVSQNKPVVFLFKKSCPCCKLKVIATGNWNKASTQNWKIAISKCSHQTFPASFKSNVFSSALPSKTEIRWTITFHCYP